MSQSAINHIVAKGNVWAHWVPDGLKFSGVVVDNPELRGHWILWPEGS